MLLVIRQLSTRLESEVVKIGGFRVVERTKIDEIMKEQKFQMSKVNKSGRPKEDPTNTLLYFET